MDTRPRRCRSICVGFDAIDTAASTGGHGSTGTSIWWSEYYPYGALRQQGKAGGGIGAPAVQPFDFIGEQLGALTSLYHLRARQYDPGTGRFMTTDPVVAPIEEPYIAAYVYALGNPVRHVDPRGRDSQGACVNFNVGVGPAQVVLEACAVQTSSGQGGLTFTFGGGAAIRDPAGWALGGGYRVRTLLAHLRVTDERPEVEYWRVRTINRFVVSISLLAISLFVGGAIVLYIATFVRASIDRYGTAFGVLSGVVFGLMFLYYAGHLGRTFYDFGNGRRPTWIELVVAVGGIVITLIGMAVMPNLDLSKP